VACINIAATKGQSWFDLVVSLWVNMMLYYKTPFRFVIIASVLC